MPDSRVFRAALVAVLTASLAAALPASSSAQPAQLFDALFYGHETGAGPTSIRLLDLDGDGRLDMLCANQGTPPGGSTTLSFLRGNGDGTFRPGTFISTGNNPSSVDAVDLDHDGKLELVVMCPSLITVHRGLGPGSFGPPVQYFFDNTAGPISLADMDGDGRLDALLPHPNYPAGVTVAYGIAPRAFGAPLNLPSVAYTAAAAAADLDGDGRPDIIATNTGQFVPDSTLAIFRNLGGRSFAATANAVCGLAPSALAAGRFNADAFTDFAVACKGDSTVRIMLADGAGHLTRTATYRFDLAPQAITAGDLNGDSKTDLVVSLQYYGLVLLFGRGDGTFGSPVPLQGPVSPGSIAIGDLDHDGLVDLAVASDWSDSFRGSIAVLPGTGGGSFGRMLANPTGNYGSESFGLADLDRDGFRDVYAGLYGAFGGAFLRGDGTGRFGPPTPDPLSAVPVGVELADLNGDHVPDLVMTTREGATPGELSIRPGHGDGTFGPGITLSLGPNLGAPHLADFNGDGVRDICVVRGYTDTVAIAYLNVGGSVDSLRFRILAGPDGFYVTPVSAVGFIDGDAWPDLVVAASTASVHVYFGNANNQFSTPISIPIGNNLTVSSVAIGDVDPDGRLDVLATCNTLSEIFVARNAGGRGFLVPRIVTTGLGPASIVVGDATGDGRPDLLTADGGFVSLLPQQPDSSFGPRLEYGVGANATQIVVSDVNGDGRPDLVVGTIYPGNNVCVLFNTNGAIVGTTWSEVASSVTADGVSLTWSAPDGSTAAMDVERNASGEGWRFLTRRVPDGSGLLRLLDGDVAPGQRYGYRLVAADGTNGHPVAEVWVDVPASTGATRFAVTPNPLTDRGWISFDLERAEDVTFELLDLQGRIVLSRQFPALVAGSHRINAFSASEMKAGVYFARLRRGGATSAPQRLAVVH